MKKQFSFSRMAVNRFANIVINTVFQRYCLICSEGVHSSEEGHICARCRRDIKKSGMNTCERCGSELTDSSEICGQCILSPPPFIKHVSYALYREKMRKLILLFKLSGKEKLRKDIAGMYREVIESHFENVFDLIVPVPPDPGRKKIFDPVSDIALVLSKIYGKPCITKNLVKNKSTDKQASLNFNRRIRNLNGAYKVLRPEEFREKSILLIDDVYTTGTTVKKCAALLDKYCRGVYGVTLAMSPNLFTRG